MPALTPAQLRVLSALCRPADGPASNEEIAAELTVSIDTVKTHMRALFDAFDLQSSAPYRKRFELVRMAVEAGLVSRRPSVVSDLFPFGYLASRS